MDKFTLAAPSIADSILNLMTEIMRDFSASLAFRTLDDVDTKNAVYVVTVTDHYGGVSEYARATGGLELEATLRLVRADLRNSGGRVA